MSVKEICAARKKKVMLKKKKTGREFSIALRYFKRKQLSNDISITMTLYQQLREEKATILKDEITVYLAQPIIFRGETQCTNYSRGRRGLHSIHVVSRS